MIEEYFGEFFFFAFFLKDIHSYDFCFQIYLRLFGKIYTRYKARFIGFCYYREFLTTRLKKKSKTVRLDML